MLIVDFPSADDAQCDAERRGQGMGRQVHQLPQDGRFRVAVHAILPHSTALQELVSLSRFTCC